ncbi:hypothetical protein [Candidiatus Paracoxiella cheracis]|uniref:hypothetical protein n=1 Tax=Candidiatus Paracoxiella cheracis TaxID=3405120 RepID=UPI003BF4F2AE
MQSDSQFTLGIPIALYAFATSYVNAQLAKDGIPPDAQGDFNLPSNIAVPLAESSSILDNFPLIFIFIT